MAQTACLDPDTLAEVFALGSGARSREAIESHLDSCGDCRSLVAAYARASDELSDAATLTEGTDAFARTVASDRPPGPAAALSSGTLHANRYLLEHVVGEGGMGVVWAARDVVSERRVALKFLKEASPELARRSWREARAAAAVGHPSLLEVLDVLSPAHEGLAPVLVMPLLEGESLDRRLLRERKLDVRTALEIIEPVVVGMAAAHAKGIIHRDLKPPNIFLARDGSEAVVPIVLDFGLAKLLSDGTDAGADKLTRTGALLGTPYYMAPEQLFGDASVDARADVWALGAVIYECVSGKRPVEGKSYGQIARNVARGTIAPLASVEPPLAHLTARMLDKEREGRPSLTEVHGTLRMLLDRA